MAKTLEAIWAMSKAGDAASHFFSAVVACYTNAAKLAAAGAVCTNCLSCLQEWKGWGGISSLGSNKRHRDKGTKAMQKEQMMPAMSSMTMAPCSSSSATQGWLFADA